MPKRCYEVVNQIVDIIGYINQEKVAIQCKRYDKNVGNKAIP